MHDDDTACSSIYRRMGLLLKKHDSEIGFGVPQAPESQISPQQNVDDPHPRDINLDMFLVFSSGWPWLVYVRRITPGRYAMLRRGPHPAQGYKHVCVGNSRLASFEMKRNSSRRTS